MTHAMSRFKAGVVSLGILASASCSPVPTRSPSGDHLVVTHPFAKPPAKGAPQNFSGDAAVTQLFGATDRTRTTAGSVTFQPGAHSAWHTHPLGQTLIITAGTGWVQQWGEKKEEVKSGDVVWTPPGVKHWHGATATESMTHIAIQEVVDGSGVSWLERVTDDQYGN